MKRCDDTLTTECNGGNYKT